MLRYYLSRIKNSLIVAKKLHGQLLEYLSYSLSDFKAHY